MTYSPDDEDKTVFISATQSQNLPQSEASKKIPPGSLSSQNSKASAYSSFAQDELATSSAISSIKESIATALKLNYRSGINPLIEDATELFFIHYQIINDCFNRPEQLRPQIQDALLKFEMRAQQMALPKVLIKSAKYILCTFLDEAVLKTEFGAHSSWSQQSLLAQFFNETWGGATVFKIRQFCLENIHDYIDLFEMIYICICLGFKGQYGSEPNGDIALERIKRETYQVIIEYRGDKLNLPLSPNGLSNYEGGRVLKRKSSLKWVLAACCAVLVVTYVSLSIFVTVESSPVYNLVSSLSNP